MLKVVAVFFIAFVASACVTPALSPDSKAGAGIGEPNKVTERGLPAQTLEPNECGLFLWSKTDASKFVFFAKAGAGKALFLLNEEPVPLQTQSEQGDIFGQFFTDIKYQAEAGHLVSLSYEPGVELTNGARISNGIIEVLAPDGWSTVLPVLGVRSCQPTFQSEESSVPSGSRQ